MTQTEASGAGNASAAPAVSVELVHTEADARAACAALGAIWTAPDGAQPFPPELAWAFAHSGNYVAVARDAAAGIVGAAIAFRGQDETGPVLHSHIAGVVPTAQGTGVGFLLKQHQRAWAIEQGFDRITWTFDPLVARNAYFNVMKLGAECTRYYVDFYGRMDDGVNGGDETDRCLVTWRINSPRARALAGGTTAVVNLEALVAAGAVEVLGRSRSDEPVVTTTDADCRIARVSINAVQLRRHDPARAREWRVALRQVLVPAFADGLAVVGVTRDGSYVLSRPSD